MEERQRSFPEERRLKKRSDFDLVMKSARGVSDASVVVYARPSKGGGTCRLGLVVGRRASLKAVRRNRIKRRLREVFRCSDIPAKNLDVVIVARNEGPADMEFAELKDRVAKLVQKSLGRGPRPEGR